MHVYTDLNQLPDFQGTVITIGSFDGVHEGHRRILERVRALARASGGESVLITFEPHPRTVLKPGDTAFKLLTTLPEKLALLEQCGLDHVVIVPFTPAFSRQPAQAYVADFLVKKFHPSHIVIGYDHRFGNRREGDLSFLKKGEPAGGYKVVEIPAQEVDEIAVSSSKIRQALEASDVLLANRLLGHPFTLTGKVVQGQQLGRELGFPTANLHIGDPYKIILPPGIYAARAGVGEASHRAMLYLGKRPTLEGEQALSIEVNLLDFEGDLYGKELTVEVLDFIRPDKKLEGLAALKQQIEADKREIEKRLERTPASAHPPGGRGDVEYMTEVASPLPEVRSVAVVILNYNTRRHLQEYLPSVLAYSPGASIIVADNGSPDDSIAYVREHFPEVQILDLQQNYGFALGYNEALRQVEADVYVVLNSDVEVTPGWMEPILSAMRSDPSIAIAQPKILAWQNRRLFEYAGAAGGWMDALGYPFCRGRIFSHTEEDQGQYDAPQECFWASGAAFFIRAEFYHAYGGFDSDYFAHNEEIDLCWRLKRAGYGVWCFPESVVYHLGGGTLEYENPRKVFLNFRNSLFTLLKNAPAATLLWLLPARFLLDGLAGLRFILKGQFRAVGAIVRAHFSFYGLFGSTLAKRKAIFQLLEKEKIKPKMNRAGIYPGSVVWAFYARQIKTFSRLFEAK